MSNNKITRHITNFEGFKSVEYLTAGEGENLIFLHGVGANPMVYKRTINYLAQKYHVIAPALPGHGSTSLEQWFREAEYKNGIDNYALFLERLLKHLNITEPFILVGHSFGGAISVRFAENYPKQVKKLILLDAAVRSVSFSKIRRDFVRFQSQFDYLKHTKSIPLDVLWDFLRNVRGIRYAYKTIHAMHLIPSLDKIIAPTTVIWGDNDTLIPMDWGFEIHEKIKGSKLKIIKGVNHAWPGYMPEEIEI